MQPQQVNELANAARESNLPKLNDVDPADTFRAEPLYFQSLRGISPEQVQNPQAEELPRVSTLRELCRLTQNQMTYMNEEYPGLPPDPTELTIDLVTRDGACTVVLTGVVPGEENLGAQILGYGIIINGKDNFPDTDIPAELLKSENASRVIRLFVTQTGRELMPRGEAFSKIIDEIKKCGGSGPIIGMVLTDIVPLKGEFEAGKTPAVWLEAKKALEVRGFDDTGELKSEEFEKDDGRKVSVHFRWYQWPPVSEQGRRLQQIHAERFADLRTQAQECMAWVSTGIPFSDARLLCIGRTGRAFDVANLHRGNVVVAPEYPSCPSGKRRVERRANLVNVALNEQGAYLPDRTADAVLILGVMPDIAGKDPARAKEKIKQFIDAQVAQLKRRGALIVRDTIAPEGPRTINVEFSQKTSADLFRTFCQDGKERHISEEEWGRVMALPGKLHTERFLAPLSVYGEFFAKQPYVKDWAFERDRAFTQFSAEERRAFLSAAGLRLLYAGPEYSAWRREKFFDSHVKLTDLGGNALPMPPTNYVTIAEKVAEHEGVILKMNSTQRIDNPRFVTLATYAQRNDAGQILDLREVATRPNLTHDVIPYSISRGQLFIRGRIYPRPILVAQAATLDGSISGGYMVEQITAIAKGEKFESREEMDASARWILRERGGIATDQVERFDEPTRVFTRPDTIDEQVVSQGVLMKEPLGDEEFVVTLPRMQFPITVRTFNGIQLLQGAQVGAFQDARMERKLYELHIKNGLSCGAWLGAKIELSAQELSLAPADVSKVVSPPTSNAYQQLDGAPYNFLEVWSGNFSELNARDEAVLGFDKLEYVVPGRDTGLGSNTISFLPLMKKADGSVLAGIEMRDFPAVQKRTGSSALATIPTFRIPATITTLDDAQNYVSRRLKKDFGLAVKWMKPLGGKYPTSPGITPEVIYPMVGEVVADASALDTLQWAELNALHSRNHELSCAQTVTSIYRAVHALKKS